MLDTQFERLEFLPILPKEVNFAMLSSEAQYLLCIYLRTIDDEEHPRDAMERTGFTPRELGLRRTKAHNALMRQLRQEGIECSNRYSITELAERYDRWIRE